MTINLEYNMNIKVLEKKEHQVHKIVMLKKMIKIKQLIHIVEENHKILIHHQYQAIFIVI